MQRRKKELLLRENIDKTTMKGQFSNINNVSQSTDIRYRNKKTISVQMAAKYKARRAGELDRKNHELAKTTQL
jgi:hypothetical protein